MSCHLLPAESTDDEICVDPAEDRKPPAPDPNPVPDSNSMFQISPEVLRALREELVPKVLVEVDNGPSVLREETAAPNLGTLNDPVS